MKRCDHSQWLTLFSQGIETALHESDRLQTLVDQIPSPDSQHPSLSVLIGSTAKSVALHELVPSTKAAKVKSRRRHGDVHLYLAASTIFHDRPVLFAEGDLPFRGSRNKTFPAEKCHETVKRTLFRLREDVPGNQQDSIANNLYSRLLCPFADVICIFAADFAGFRPIVRHLGSWLEKGLPSTLPKSTHPWLIIVTETTTLRDTVQEGTKKLFLSMLKDETTQDISTLFSEVEVLCILPDGQVSAKARFRPLKECLMNASTQVRLNKMDTRTLFSARHFAVFFKLACDHFAITSNEPFDFIRTSRCLNPVSPDLNKHLSNFLLNIRSSHELTKFAVPVIASSFLLDSYPPDMHGTLVFILARTWRLTLRQFSAQLTYSRLFIERPVMR